MEKTKIEDYRNTGAIGALLDEYERAIEALRYTLADISDHELTVIVDHQTKDPDCRSIETILNHVIRAGNGYILSMRRHIGENLDRPEASNFKSIESFSAGLNRIFEAAEHFFTDYPDIEIEEHRDDRKIKTSWGQSFDIEQLFEHAIVHILRHRRQIERFKLMLRSQ